MQTLAYCQLVSVAVFQPFNAYLLVLHINCLGAFAIQSHKCVKIGGSFFEFLGKLYTGSWRRGIGIDGVIGHPETLRLQQRFVRSANL